MMTINEHVNSSNISKISLSTAFNKSARTQAIPTVESIYQKIIKKFDEKLLICTTEENSQRTQNTKDKFIALVHSEMPTGFELTPVLISRIGKDDNEKTRKEYYHSISKRFMRYIAASHKDELLQLGINEKSTKAMKNGLSPRFKNSPAYELSTDHIVERGNGGMLSLTKEKDIINASNGNKSFIVNHFNNLVLIPQTIHKLKNDIKDCQSSLYVNTILAEDDIWFLMLTPKYDSKLSGFVCPKQENNELYGLTAINKKSYKKNNI